MYRFSLHIPLMVDIFLRKLNRYTCKLMQKSKARVRGKPFP
ncbi:hypothetical protein HMPREF9069_01181 [Atopobium sp. oral taxon 810 str. F0209]|nr:hypothetical protein HMPREF9069_01181 [Atopobium sp. oral taxon 810 str. F0209]